MELKILLIPILISQVNSYWNLKLNNPHPAFDPTFYEEVLDTKQCQKQLSHIVKDNVLLAIKFADAGARFPRNVLGGSLLDLGNYHQCLSIDHSINDMEIKGKYCSILIHVGGINASPSKDKISTAVAKPKTDRTKAMEQGMSGDKLIKKFNSKLTIPSKIDDLYSKVSTRNDEFRSVGAAISLGICIPKVCSTHEVLNSSLLYNASGLIYSENFCRLPNDKPWSPADTSAVFIFSIIGILTVLSTAYDVNQRFVLKRDASLINSKLQTFSVYTNGCHLITFSSGHEPLRCLDGIRVLATAWIVLGHTFHTQLKLLNALDLLTFSRTLDFIYIVTSPMSVDTFFTIGGILLVYTNCGKITGNQLLKNLHRFYLHRVLRMFPLLATVVLLQASFFHRLSDGPFWQTVATATNNCRTQWWITLLYLQNYFDNICLGHSWYLAIDVQLHFLSPLVLFWVLGGSRKPAWLALTAGLITVLTGAIIYNFRNNFLSNAIPPIERIDDTDDYMHFYYVNTLTRSSPFFIGMMFGYLLHIYKGKRVLLTWKSVALLWSSSAAIMASIGFLSHSVVQEDWNNQFIDNIMNSFMRPAWAMAIGWIVFACVHDYGGPINWFLSLDMWRLPSRLCYGVYLFHYPIIFVVCDSVVAPVYFSQLRFIFMFTAYLSISFFVSYFATLLINVPFTIIFKWLIEIKKSEKPVE